MAALSFRRCGSPGFSLIELLAVVAMVATLSAIAYPGLRAPVLRARRSDAQVALLQLQLAQERWRAGNPRYGTLAEVGMPAASPAGHYRLEVESPGESGFDLLAIAIGFQAADTPCRLLRLKRVDGHLLQASGPDAQARNGHEANRRCWNQ